MTLSDLLQLLVDDPTLGPQLGKPSVSVGSRNLYLRGALESTFAGNLSKVRDGGGSYSSSDSLFPLSATFFSGTQ